MQDLLPEINQLGFDIPAAGKDTFVIHGVPPELENQDERKVLEELIEQCKADQADLKLNKHEIPPKVWQKQCHSGGQETQQPGNAFIDR